MYMEVTQCHLTSRLHHLVELGLNVKLRVLGLDALQLDCHLDSCLDIGACGCGRCVGVGRREGGTKRGTIGTRHYLCDSVTYLTLCVIHMPCTHVYV